MNAIVKAPYVAREYGRKDNGGAGNGGSDKLLEAVETLKKQIAENNEQTKEHGTKLLSEVEKHGAATTELKGKVDQTLVKHAELEGKLQEIEQKLARRGAGNAVDERKSWGQAFVESEKGKALMAAGSGRAKVEVKAITTDPASAGDLIQPQRVGDIITPPQRRMTIRDLLMSGTTGSDSIEFVKETGFTNNARPVTETNLKPESTITFDAETVPVRTIAHWIQASKQALADAAQLRSHIDGRMRYGLAYKEELQLLLGDGQGQNIHGLKPQATAFSSPLPLGTGFTKIDVLRLAMLQVRLAEYPSNGIILNPIDWTEIELTKDANGGYIFANPQSLAGPVLWGLPVIDTQAQPTDEFTVGAFNMVAQIFDRETATVEVSAEDRDNFIRNMVTIRAEERLALAVYRPESIVDGDFTSAGV